jgi:hypothetical protein
MEQVVEFKQLVDFLSSLAVGEIEDGIYVNSHTTGFQPPNKCYAPVKRCREHPMSPEARRKITKRLEFT